MPSPRRHRPPLVYVDTCCFGLTERTRPDAAALDSLGELLHHLNSHLLRFLGSSWLEVELERAEPRSAARRLLAQLPASDEFVPWEGSLARDALRWVPILGLGSDPSAEADCRHLACALRGGADFLVTMDRRFHEAMRQHILLIAPVRPVWLPEWREVIYGRKYN